MLKCLNFQFFLKIYHKNTANVWQPYLIEGTFEKCAPFEERIKWNEIKKRAATFFRQYDNTVGGGCPINVRI